MKNPFKIISALCLLSSGTIMSEILNLETLWEKDHSVTINDTCLDTASITIDGIGIFKFHPSTEKNQLAEWKEVREIGGGSHQVVLTIYRPWFFGWFITQTITIPCKNFDMSADDIVEITRLAYNDWIASLNEKEHLEFLKNIN